ncbi:MAG: ABC transporter substrate-binding protein [Candidatus Colwellbacteria bacterium]|nr:ABC transporter substrate-binding protein [Candidatus Colwellbacteria bacterium]MBI3273720.1 ABC transporter substrate-binding protein [Candidatus Colwellbacteria bacterium]
MKKIILGIAVLLVIIVGVFAIMRTQNRPTALPTPSRVYHIGILSRGRGLYEVAIKGFQDQMRELGYVEGQNVTYDIRYLSTKEELDAAAQDFVNANVDLINTYSTPATRPVYEATQKMSNPIPIIFGSLNYPVASGFIKSVEQPGANVTGIISLSTELTAKRIELLARIIPGIKKIAMPRGAVELNDIAVNNSVTIAEQAAKNLGIELVFFPVRTKEEIVSSAPNITAQRVQGMIVGGDSLVWGGLDEYIKQAIKEKLPLAVFGTDQVKRGALIGFGADYTVMGQQIAVMSDKIIKGKKPGDIPVETPKKLILAINLDTARAIGITLDPELLKEAEVIIGK